MKIKDLLECELLVGGGYPEPQGDVNITENGQHDVKDYATATVNVPQPNGSTNITTNGTFDVAQFAQAVVNVSGGGGGAIVEYVTPTDATTLTLSASLTGKNFVVIANHTLSMKSKWWLLSKINGKFLNVGSDSSSKAYGDKRQQVLEGYFAQNLFRIGISNYDFNTDIEYAVIYW